MIADDTGSGVDSDPGGAADPLAISSHTNPAGGSLTIDPSGAFSYLPNIGFTGGDGFTYTVSDGDGGLATATVTILVVNRTPSIDPIGDQIATEGTEFTLPIAAHDPDAGQALSYSLVGVVPPGATIDPATGIFRWTPADGPADFDFTVRVTDSGSPPMADEESLRVHVANAPPVITRNRASVTVGEGATAANQGTFTDPGLDTVTLGASVGTVVADANGGWSWSWSTSDGPEDSQTVTITATDSDGLAATTSFLLTVNNLPPTAVANAYVTAAGVAVSGNVIADDSGSGIDSDAAGPSDPLTIGSHTNPANGGLALNQDGSFTYTPTAGFSGIDSFTYTISDGDGGLATASTTIDVAPSSGDEAGVRVVGNVLQIVGTAGADEVEVRLNHRRVVVVAGFLPGGTVSIPAAGLTTLDARLGDGDDEIRVAGDLRLTAFIDGGEGDDEIKSGGGPSLVLGGLGDDRLIGGRGRNVLIGGAGRDRLQSGGASDLLIAGTTAYDQNDAALAAILQEWTSSRCYARRVANLRDGAGPVLNATGIKLRKGSTVFDDGDADQLQGGADLDWYFYELGRDKVSGKKPQEAAN